MLSLVATAMNEVKIYRSVLKTPGPDDNASNTSSNQLIFYEAAKLPMHPALLRDVQWAPFNVRGTDLIATACRDGGVRIYEMDITPTDESPSMNNRPSSSNNGNGSTTSGAQQSQNPSQRPVPQSSLTTAIAGRTNINPTTSSSGLNPPSIGNSRFTPRTQFTFPLTTTLLKLLTSPTSTETLGQLHGISTVRIISPLSQSLKTIKSYLPLRTE